MSFFMMQDLPESSCEFCFYAPAEGLSILTAPSPSPPPPLCCLDLLCQLWMLWTTPGPEPNTCQECQIEMSEYVPDRMSEYFFCQIYFQITRKKTQRLCQNIVSGDLTNCTEVGTAPPWQLGLGASWHRSCQLGLGKCPKTGGLQI